MIDRYATAEDFARWEAKARTMTSAALVYSAKDAAEAARAADQMGCTANSGRYTDESLVYLQELRSRKVAAQERANEAVVNRDEDSFRRHMMDFIAATQAEQTLNEVQQV